MLSYEELAPAERELWDAFPEGRSVDLRADTPDDDPAEGDRWGPERTIRAVVLAALLLGASPGQPFTVAALRLAGARITGRLDLSGSEIDHMLWLEGCWFDEIPSFCGATTRTIVIHRCELPGIDATMAQINGRLDLRHSVLHGRLALLNSRIAGELVLTDSTVLEPSGWALWAGGLMMESGVFCHRLIAHGGIRLPGAHLPGGLFMQGAQVQNPGASAFVADNATASTMVFSEGFTAQGTVRLRGAQIRDELTFDGAVLSSDGVALDCSRMQAGDFSFTPAAPPVGAVDLQGAQVTVLHDAKDAWPDVVRLQGFVYESIQPSDGIQGTKATHRVAWIRREPGYAPQPYEQLATWYRRVGHDDGARRVLLAKQRHYRSTLRPAGRLWGHLLDATVGYGYRPWLAGLWLLALSLLGTTVFSTAHSPKPVQPDQGPPFNAFVYTLDLLIPIGGLGQRNAWYWTGDAAQWLAYALIAAGWILTTAVVAGVSRSLNKT